MALFSGLFSNKAAEEAAAAQKQGFQQGETRAGELLRSGATGAQGYLGQAAQGFVPYTSTGAAANDMWANSVGLNGPGGNTAATNAFQASPGYGYQLDQGIQAANRAAGGVFSGNLTNELQRTGQGMANQDYRGWQDSLRAGGTQGLQAAGMQGNIYGQQAGVETDLGKQLGQNAWSSETGQGQAEAAAQMNKYAVGANQLGAIMGAAKLAGGLAFGPAGGMASSLMGLGGGGGMPYGAQGGAYGNAPGQFNPNVRGGFYT